MKFYLFSYSFFVLVFSSGCLAGWRSNNAPSYTQIQSSPESIEIFWEKNLPLIDVYLNSKGPYRFLLDTGAETSVISPECAQEVGLDIVVRKMVIGGVASSVGGGYPTVTVENIKVGGALFEDVPAVISKTSEGMNGILGFPVFSKLIMTLDGPNKKLLLSHGELDSAVTSSTIFDTKPGNLKYESPEIFGTLADIRSLFLIDSGFDGFLFIPKSFIRRMELDFKLDPSKKVIVQTRTSKYEVEMGTLGSKIKLGSIELKNYPVMVSRWGRLILGSEFLKRCVATFDQKNGRVQIMVKS